MGAYFLLKYGAALTIDLALCFSPQFSIDPGRVGRFDNRFRAHFFPPCMRTTTSGRRTSRGGR